MSDVAQSIPAVLLPYQQRWVADRSRVKIHEKSRRIGITWATAAEAALEAAEENGQDVFYVSHKRENAREFIDNAAEWARNYQLAAGTIEEVIIEDEDKDILAFVIRFASGYRVMALSSRPSNLRGLQGYVILDEAAFHPDLRELFKAAKGMFVWGGRIAIMSTHNGVDNPFNELCEDAKAKRNNFSHHRVTFDEALVDGLYKRICLVKGLEHSSESEAAWRLDVLTTAGDDADEEFHCIPRRSGGAYIPRTLIEDRMVPGVVVRWQVPASLVGLSDFERERIVAAWCHENLLGLLEALPPRLMHFFGEDFGRHADRTVMAPLTLGQDLVRRVPWLVELGNAPFKAQEQILYYIVDRLPRFIAGALDAGGNGMFLAEAAATRYGAERISQVALSDKWYSEQLPPFKAAFEDSTVELVRDVDVLNDLRQLQMIDGVPKLPKKKTKGQGGEQRHGDAAIALALAYYASRLDVQEYGYVPVPLRAPVGSDGGFANRPRRSTDTRPVKVTAAFKSRRGVF